jgi:hypothetical protein
MGVTGVTGEVASSSVCMGLEQSRVEAMRAYAVNILSAGAMKQVSNAFTILHFLLEPNLIEVKLFIQIGILDALHRDQHFGCHRLVEKFGNTSILSHSRTVFGDRSQHCILSL